MTEVEIGTDVTSIGLGAFVMCETLVKVKIPNSVTSIGEGAFASCTSLESVVVPNSVTSIGEGAFAGCSSLSSVVIPKSVESIGSNAFHSTAVEYINITTGMTPVPNTLAFDGITKGDIETMDNYPWGITIK